MARRSRKPKNPVTVVVWCLIFFGLFTVAMFATSQRTGDPLGYGFGMIGLSVSIFCLVIFTLGPENEKGRRHPSAVGWAVLLIAPIPLIIGPILLRTGGYEWVEMLGSGRRRLPLWAFGVLCWGAAVSVYVGAAISGAQALKRRRS